ncbi:MAG: YicC family protein [Bacteroidales bacterium]|nr:YicC family protein [Bacteroidales bacterium]
MIQSMTGYGKARAILDGGALTVEIRTLNSKSADINVKSSLLPKDKDIEIRKKMASRLQRGTIDVYLTWEPSAADAGKIINAELLKEYLSAIKSVVPVSGDSADAALVSAVLRLPDVTSAERKEIITEENWPLVEEAFDRAMDALEAYRLKEGAVLYRDVISRVDNILGLYEGVEALEGERIDAVREKFSKAIEELSAKPNPERLEQEMIFYLEKYDINEEKVRLRQHCKYFRDTIDSEPYPGKKLGFIIQEMGREINTTGSKANHAGIQKLVVQMKDELEKAREQSMNIL